MPFAYVCGNCGSATNGKNETPGSFLIEIVLWFFFIVPGLIYSIWRLTSRHRVCSECSANSLLPAGSPRARQIAGGKSPPAKVNENDYL